MKKLLLITMFIQLLSFPNGYSDTVFPKSDKFFIGIANAPVQVEDLLPEDDNFLVESWKDNSKIFAYKNQINPDSKLEFWSKPEIEINLASELGIDVFRLGIDWNRLMRITPPMREAELDESAVLHYLKILKLIKNRNMKVMLTLFHHSEPGWTLKNKSWANSQTKKEFLTFTRLVLPRFLDDVDYLVTFNEAQIYAMFTQVKPLWPSYKEEFSPLEIFNFAGRTGLFETALNHMAQAHKEIYQEVKISHPNLPVGIAHNIADYKGQNFYDKIFSKISWKKMNYLFLDKTIEYSDFIGLNFYGVESIKNFKAELNPKIEYSDSGRGISPNGFYHLLKKIHHRYKGLNKPIIITENGIADEADIYRPLYVIEHLKVLKKLMDEGVSILGYIHWTLTDNFEWADGYCPKFGLVAVDRETNERIPRDSFYLLQKIASTRVISIDDEIAAFAKITNMKGKKRATCRALDAETSLDNYRYEDVKGVDWRVK